MSAKNNEKSLLSGVVGVLVAGGMILSATAAKAAYVPGLLKKPLEIQKPWLSPSWKNPFKPAVNNSVKLKPVIIGPIVTPKYGIRPVIGQ